MKIIRLGREIFPEPRQLASYYSMPGGGGVYTIFAPDRRYDPVKYHFIYVGQTANFHRRLHRKHHKNWYWCGEAGIRLGKPSAESQQYIYVSLLPIPDKSALHRKLIETELIEQYHPPCNDRCSLNPVLTYWFRKEPPWLPNYAERILSEE